MAASQSESESPSRVLAVLGMHRSGTSWLAGSLEEKGLFLGEVSREDPFNRRGNREHPALMEIHEGVLRDNGGSWKRPAWPNRWSEERRAALAEFIASNAGHPFWGFKDPRALLCLDEWHRQVPGLLRVGIFRHPLAVHRSLAARNPRFKEARSLELWRAYNERLAEEHARDPFPVLRFDLAPEALAGGLDEVARGLGLPAADRSCAFFDEALVHQGEAGGGPVPRRCRDLWATLEGLAART